MKTFVLAAAAALIASPVFAQTPAPPPQAQSPAAQSPRADDLNLRLATPTGQEISAGIAGYAYHEPGDTSISIHSPMKLTAAYMGTMALSRQHHWFLQADVRGTLGNVTYDGWCSPFLISPNSDSPNGYELDIGDPSPCNESGDRDWYLEGRALTGKDVIGSRWGVAPYGGIGVRHLSNGTTGTPGYRIDNYLYLPIGVTARTALASRRALSLTLEFDQLLRGWQDTHDSDLGGGTVPATNTAPAFTIDGFTDVSFSQHGGWAIRASASFDLNRRWFVSPYYVRWSVKSSPVNYETVTFTVNNIAAQEQLGAYEPYNTTNEFGVRLGIHF